MDAASYLSLAIKFISGFVYKFIRWEFKLFYGDDNGNAIRASDRPTSLVRETVDAVSRRRSSNTDYYC
jgi:hypothetical protein